MERCPGKSIGKLPYGWDVIWLERNLARDVVRWDSLGMSARKRSKKQYSFPDGLATNEEKAETLNNVFSQSVSLFFHTS